MHRTPANAVAARVGQAMVAATAIGVLCILVVIPRATGGRALTVLSGSMTPTFPVGSVIVVSPVDPTEVETGDAITFANNSGSLTTHRVTEVRDVGTDLSFITKGDANDAADKDPVAASAVRGRVWFHVPLLGYVHNAVARPAGLTVIAALVLLIVAWERLERVGHRILRPRRREKASDTLESPARSGANAGPGSRLTQPDCDAGPGPLQLLVAEVGIADGHVRELIAVVSALNGQMLFTAPQATTISFVGTPEHLAMVEDALERHDVREIERSSVVRLHPPSAPVLQVGRPSSSRPRHAEGGRLVLSSRTL